MLRIVPVGDEPVDGLLFVEITPKLEGVRVMFDGRRVPLTPIESVTAFSDFIDGKWKQIHSSVRRIYFASDFAIIDDFRKRSYTRPLDRQRFMASILSF